MMKEPERIMLPTIVGSQASIDLNWSHGSSEYVKLQVGRHSAVIPRAAVVRLAMMLAKEEEQDNLVPTKQVRMRHFSKKYTVRLKKDMAEGELLTIPVSFDVELPSGNDNKILNSSTF